MTSWSVTPPLFTESKYLFSENQHEIACIVKQVGSLQSEDLTCHLSLCQVGGTNSLLVKIYKEGSLLALDSRRTNTTAQT